jgi:ribose transport system permease protein
MNLRQNLSSLHRKWLSLPPWTGALLALVILVVITASLNPAFLRGENVLNVLRQSSFWGIIALGMTFVIILGGIDLSVGSVVAFAGGLSIVVMNTAINAATLVSRYQEAMKQPFLSPPCGVLQYSLARVFLACGLGGHEGLGVLAAFLVALAAGLLSGWITGLLVTKGRLAPFIATLGGLAAYRSLVLVLANGGELRSESPNLFKIIGAGGLPIPGTNLARMADSPPIPLLFPWPVLLFLLFAVLSHILLTRTRYGRYVVAVGCNERAAVYSAINVERIKLLTYVLIGFLTGVAALLVASRMNSVSSSSTGLYFELDVIAAVVIGGTSMAGGKGTIVGTVIGVLILGVVGNMLNLLQVSPYLQGLVKGLIIVTAVLVQRRPGGEE